MMQPQLYHLPEISDPDLGYVTCRVLTASKYRRFSGLPEKYSHNAWLRVRKICVYKIKMRCTYSTRDLQYDLYHRIIDDRIVKSKKGRRILHSLRVS